MIEDLNDTDLFTLINIINIVEDFAVIVPALIVIKKIHTGPSFVLKGLVLVTAECVIDACYQGASIYYTHPPFVIEVFLYTLSAMDYFIDVMIFWTISFMYWVTAINIAEFNEE